MSISPEMGKPDRRIPRIQKEYKSECLKHGPECLPFEWWVDGIIQSKSDHIKELSEYIKKELPHWQSYPKNIRDIVYGNLTGEQK